jgi:hypothetical protein
VKEAILKAGEAAGGAEGLVGYLQTQARENSTSFLTLLGKVLPLQVTGGAGGPIIMRWVNEDEPAPDA